MHQRGPTRLHHLLPRRLPARTPHSDIIMHAHVKEYTPLRDARHIPTGERLVQVVDVLVVERYRPALGLVHPQEQLCDGRFARAGAPDYEGRLVRGEVERYVGEDGHTRARGVCECDVVQGEFPGAFGGDDFLEVGGAPGVFE